MSVQVPDLKALEEPVRRIAAESGTPFFLLDEARFADNIARFRRALEVHHDRIVIGYSVKTNYTPGLVSLAKRLGCWAEVVSRMELELARKLEFPNGEVIFNGPYKTADDLALAIELGAMINLDSVDQVRTLLSLDVELRAQARVALRLNVDLARRTRTEGKIATGGLVPRFGLPEDDVAEAVSLLRGAGLKIRGLHGHCSSSDRQPENYTQIAQIMLEVIEAQTLADIELLDVGGGFMGVPPELWEVTDPPSFEDYAAAIMTPFLENEWFRRERPFVAIEPGMAVIADTFSYVAKVVAKKHLMDRDILGVDGNYYDVRPTMHQKPLPYLHIKSGPGGNDSGPFIVVGSTCMERDILLFDAEMPEGAAVDDLIVIGNVGAYTSVLSPHFINYAAPIVSLRKDNATVTLRKRQELDEFFACYHFGDAV